MKIISWNINGIRSNIICEGTLKKNFVYEELINSNLKELIDKHNPDIICFQETKCSEEIGQRILSNDSLYPYKFWHESKGEGRRGSGYSGTSIWCKEKPIDIKYEFNDFKDTSGRFIFLEFESFSLINMYCPNSGGNLDYRKEWDKSLKNLMDSKLDKPFVLAGDFNVVHDKIDIWNPLTLRQGKMPGLLLHERYMFSKFLENYVDTFRNKYPERQQFTWWNTITKSRLKNQGWRLDYFLIQKKFIDLVIDSTIDNNIIGSDHCPIILEFANTFQSPSSVPSVVQDVLY